MLMEKDFSVFDCDAHINEPHTIWSDYVEPEYREAVKAAFWKDEDFAYLTAASASLIATCRWEPSAIRFTATTPWRTSSSPRMSA